MFVDKVRIFAQAGNGGNGCVSFRREKYIERGGPDGGDGGRGGDVILVADKDVDNLIDLYYTRRLIAKHGGHGRGKGCTGKSARDVIVPVPIGTQVFRLTLPARSAAAAGYHPGAATKVFSPTAQVGLPFTPGRIKAMGGMRAFKKMLAAEALAATVPAAAPQDEEQALPTGAEAAPAEAAGSAPAEEPRELIADLITDGQRFVLAKGGRGGRGSLHFKSSTHQAPREFEYGEPGEQLDAGLELKTLADVGLVGYPNAGKSTLISQITNAHPKIASYPFTTLTPNVGVLAYDDFTRIRIADIPGLIEGAHTGKGLGHDFLRHIERCQLLLIMLDMAGVDGRKPLADYQGLLKELELYNPAILDKPRLVVANKMDLPQARKNLAALKRKRRVATFEISALAGNGLEKLKRAMRKALAP